MARAQDLSVVLLTLTILSSPAIADAYVGCGGRLERALEALQREKWRRSRVEEEEEETKGWWGAERACRAALASAPFELLVKRINVKFPADDPPSSARWARVESCLFEPNNGSLNTRLTFEEVSVSGTVSLQPKTRAEARAATRGAAKAALESRAEGSCEMTLRMRDAGIEFFTSPISRGRGQMRIRTESSFAQPRFASIYVFGCRPYGYAGMRSQGQDETDNNQISGLEPRRVRDGLLEHSSLESKGSKESSIVLREVEDVFLQAAGQALARYIERQLHPAIKETLMLSMGYTISYG